MVGNSSLVWTPQIHLIEMMIQMPMASISIRMRMIILTAVGPTSTNSAMLRHPNRGGIAPIPKCPTQMVMDCLMARNIGASSSIGQISPVITSMVNICAMNQPVKLLGRPTSRAGPILAQAAVLTAVSIQPMSIQTKMECQMVGKFNIAVGLDKHSMGGMIGL